MLSAQFYSLPVEQPSVPHPTPPPQPSPICVTTCQLSSSEDFQSTVEIWTLPPLSEGFLRSFLIHCMYIVCTVYEANFAPWRQIRACDGTNAFQKWRIPSVSSLRFGPCARQDSLGDVTKCLHLDFNCEVCSHRDPVVHW